MRHFALYDANQGNFLWFGSSVGIPEAIRALDKACDGLYPDGEQRLGIYEGTEEQISAIELWHRIPSNRFPKEIGKPIILDATSLKFIVKGLEWMSNSLLVKLGIPIPSEKRRES